jgi:hypothetical protein
MKTTCFLVFFFLFSILLEAQNVGFDKKITLNKLSATTHPIYFKEFKVSPDSNTKSEPEKIKDTLMYNMYGDLLNDDPQYNKKSPWWKPAVGVVLGNFVTCAFNKYILNSGYCNIGWQSIRDNWNNGWEWDRDRFGVNFLHHPYSGAMSFNHGRT